jgi:hypothetical protein
MLVNTAKTIIQRHGETPFETIAPSRQANPVLALRYIDIREPFRPQRRGKRVGLIQFAMHEPHPRLRRQQRAQLSHQVVMIRVPGESIQIDDVGPFVPGPPANLDGGAALK